MEFISYECDGHIALIHLTRPERLNAMSSEMADQLTSALLRFDKDDEAWVAILTGEGRAFCAGRDLKQQVERGGLPEWRYSWEFNIFGLIDTDKPIIAAVNGLAIGIGWYIALGCDIRIAAKSAEFSMGEVPTGVLGPFWLAPAEGLPYAKAFEYAVMGKRVSAGRLLELGVLNEVVPDEDVLKAATRWAEELVALPPKHVQRTKKMMRLMRRSPDESLQALEREVRRYLSDLEDTREAANAFVEKRTPVFKGR
ncbi:enoyl-CoA hydratase/isomerase family protein [Thermodesulfobacteriota bacterium]